MTALCGSRQWQALAHALGSRVHKQWIAHDRQRMRAAAAASPWRRCYSSAAAALSCGRCAAELRPAEQSLRQLSLEPCRERHLGTSKAGCYVACHARSVRAMCCQTSRVRSQGRHKSRNGPTRRRRSDCMIARERAQRRCVVEGRSRGAGSPVPCLFECLFRWTQAPSVWGAAPKRFRMSVTQQTRHKGRTR